MRAACTRRETQVRCVESKQSRCLSFDMCWCRGCVSFLKKQLAAFWQLSNIQCCYLFLKQLYQHKSFDKHNTKTDRRKGIAAVLTRRFIILTQKKTCASRMRHGLVKGRVVLVGTFWSSKPIPPQPPTPLKPTHPPQTSQLPKPPLSSFKTKSKTVSKTVSKPVT